MKALHLHIERIVVDGLTASQRRQFVGALEEKLNEMTRHGLSRDFGGARRRHIASLDAGVLGPGARAAEAATQVAHSIRLSLAPQPGRASSSRTGPNRVGGPRHV